MKVVMLIPCLMLDTNRDKNLEAQRYALDNYKGIDKIVIYDQCFKDSDYLDGITYIGHQKEKQGFITPRNELLKWFYNSDYDYAVWMDGNKYVSKTSLNDFNTVIDNINNNNIDVDFIFSTIGINISPERMELKKRPDYFKNIYLIYKTHGYEYFHGMFMKNLKKYYNDELYMTDECDVWKGLNEDIYFSKLVRELYDTYLCPTIIINTPSASSSTWMTGKGSYDYPPVDHPVLRVMAKVEASKHKAYKKEDKILVYKYDRLIDNTLEDLKEYKSRKKT